MSFPLQLTRRSLICLAVLLAVFAVCERAARRLLPVVPGCSEAARNPFRFRGWPEYMSGVDTAKAKGRLLLLSNSQAYSGEQPVQKSYPALLRRDLNERRARQLETWDVLNWSIDGTTSMEYMLMSAAARRARPTLILAVVGFADFRAANVGQGFSFCRSDVPRLALYPAVLRELPVSFLRRHYKVEDTLTAWVSDRLALRRLRDYGWSWLDARFPGAQTVFYAPRVNYRFWELKARPLAPPSGFPGAKGGEEFLDFSYDESSAVLLDEYLGQLARMPCKVVVVSAPIRANRQDKRLVFQERFQADLERLTAAHGLAYWNMQDALPKGDFITSSHFNPRNHELFARLLTERIEQEPGF